MPSSIFAAPARAGLVVGVPGGQELGAIVLVAFVVVAIAYTVFRFMQGYGDGRA